MNRTGLTIALGIGFAVGVICAVDPQLDLDIAGAFFDPARHLFDVNAQMWVQHTREAARVL
ncbi:MAG: PAP2 family protein, partial [Xanthobacteraceae bacterium]